MKKMILALLALTLVGAGIQTAKAGDCGWSTAGKILTGVVAGVAISQALTPSPPPQYYTAPGYSYCPPAPVVVAPAPPPVIYAPAPPVVVYRAPVCVAPAPVISFRFGYGHPHYYRHDRW
jgi:hypothetical protein